MQTMDPTDGTGARRRARNAGGLAALAAGTALMLAACSGSGAAAGAAAGNVPDATAAPAAGATAAPAATTDLTGGGGYGAGGYGGGAVASDPPAASVAAGGGEAHVVSAATDASVGPYLTGDNGMTLYIFTKDSPGASVCDGQCAANWPPFTLTSGETVKAGAGVTGTFATITRSDGTAQVTYNDTPLYYFAADKKAGDVVGQGVGGVWFIAAP